MLEAIAKATQHVHLETYIVREDTIGNLFKDALIACAKRGVAVRFVYDAFGGMSLSEGFVQDLRRVGVQVLVYRPLRFKNWGRWSRRDHRKILIVDGERAFTGGLNIADDYAPEDVGGKGWRDTHCSIRGPAVAELEVLFADVWHREGGIPYSVASSAQSVSQAGQLAAVLSSGYRGKRTAIRRWYMHAINRAKDFIYVANAYFLPDPGIVRALVRASKRGVDVHVMTSANSDVKLVQFASESLYTRLLRGGVHVHLWPETNMHAKTAVIDNVWSAVGSYNLDYVSLFHNLEVVVAMLDEPFGQVMKEMFHKDRSYCHQVSLPRWRKRTLGRKILSWICYRFRRWL